MTIWEMRLSLLKISDIVVLLTTWAVAQNLLLTVLFKGRKYLEDRLDMTHYGGLLKGMIISLLFLVPAGAGVSLFTLSYQGFFLSQWYAFEQPTRATWGYTIERMPFSQTGAGDHWIFWGIFLIWLIGFLYWGIWRRGKDALILRKIREIYCEAPKDRLREQKEKLESEYRIRSKIRLWQSELVSVPFVMGLISQNIIFPKRNMTEKEEELLLRHELLHCKYRDGFYRELLYWLCACCWFNPLVYRLTDYFVEVNEMACDERVLKRLSKADRFCYGKLLYEMSVKQSRRESFGMVVSFGGEEKSRLEKRLENMKSRHRKKGLVFLAAVAIAVAFACPVTTFAAAYGVSEGQNILASEIQRRWYSTEVPSNEKVAEIYEPVSAKTNEMFFCEEFNENTEVWESSGRSVHEYSVDINGKKKIGVTDITVSKGDKVTVYASGDNTTDLFQIGLQSSSGSSTYVTASGGEVTHTFTISKAGSYTVYIGGMANKDIYVYLSITVR